jgi:signal transduction histidine kinase
MNGRGKLTIEAGNAFLDDNYALAHPDVSPGQYVMIAVSDTGCGIAPEILEKVFDPFFSTKPAGKGTGLGLSMVHGFVKQSGGHIKIYSELGQGSTVRIYLPQPGGCGRTARAGRKPGHWRLGDHPACRG